MHVVRLRSAYLARVTLAIVVVVSSLSAWTAAAEDAPESFDLQTGFTSATDATVLLHIRALSSGGVRPVIVLEGADGSEILRVEWAGNADVLYFSNGTGSPKVAMTRRLTYGALLILRLHGSTYEAVLNDLTSLTLNTNSNVPATRAWSNNAGTNTKVKYYRVVFGTSDLVATTFQDDALPGWTVYNSPLGETSVEKDSTTGERSLGYVWVHARALPGSRDAFVRPIGTTATRYRAAGSFAMSPFLEDAAEGVGLLAGLESGGEMAWAITARSTGIQTWAIVGINGDGSTWPIGNVVKEECPYPSCDPWADWNTLTVIVNNADGTWAVELNGVPAGTGSHGGGATHLAFGDVFEGAPLLGPSGAGGVRIDNVWSAGLP